MEYLAIIGFVAPLAHAYAEGLAMPKWRYSRNGALHFVAFWRIRVSFCLARKST